MSGTSTSQTFTPTISATANSATTFGLSTIVSLTVTYYTSAAKTTVLSTRTESVVISQTKQGEQGEQGNPGDPGDPGTDGLKTVSGSVYFTGASAPSTPTADSYDISNGTFTNLTTG